MSRLHDMGGRFGDGSIPVPRNNNNEVNKIVAIVTPETGLFEEPTTPAI